MDFLIIQDGPRPSAKALSKLQLRAACHLRRGLHLNLGADVSSGAGCPLIALRPRERGWPLATRYGLTALYLLRTAQYQFCNCGVLYIYACRGRLALNQPWDHGGQRGKESEEGKESKEGDRQEEKEVAFTGTQYL
jgi:hypothetical protein